MHTTREIPFPTYLDSSMLATAGACQRQFFLKYMRHLAPRTQSIHLIAGGAFAAGCEAARRAFYLAKATPEAAIGAAVRAAVSHWGTYEAPFDTPKTLVAICEALFAYFTDWYEPDSDPLKPYYWGNGDISVEMTFAVPLPGVFHPVTEDPILYVGRPDFLGKYGLDGLTFLCDEKTTSQLGVTWTRNWDLRGQFLGYAWASQEMLGIKIDGTLVRGVAFKKRDIDTAEVVLLHSQWLLSDWLERTCYLVKDLITAWERAYWRPDFDNSCTSYGGCSFTSLCTRRNMEPWIDMDFEVRKWDPLGSNT